MVDEVMADIFVAYIVMTDVIMANLVMAFVVMADEVACFPVADSRKGLGHSGISR